MSDEKSMSPRLPTSFVSGPNKDLKREYKKLEKRGSVSSSDKLAYLKKKLNVRGGIAGCGEPSVEHDLAALEAIDSYLAARPKSAAAAKAARTKYANRVSIRLQRG